MKEADLTQHDWGLWFPADWEKKFRQFTSLIHLQELCAIEDDTGAFSRRRKRLKEFEHLRGEVRGNIWKTFGGKQGRSSACCWMHPHGVWVGSKSVKGKAQVT